MKQYTVQILAVRQSIGSIKAKTAASRAAAPSLPLILSAGWFIRFHFHRSRIV